MKLTAKPMADLESGRPVEGPPGIVRTTLAFTEEAMICHFTLKKGAVIPLHQHPAAQAGYMISGRMRFLDAEGRETLVIGGGSWAFAPEEPHGVEVLADSEVVECFTPARPEFIDNRPG